MLTELRVRNLALIAATELELGPGLTVLSGETGAGKTALLSSLKLLIGERGDSTMVGSVDDEARVEAVFSGLPAGQEDPTQQDPSQQDPAQQDPAQQDLGQQNSVQQDPAQQDLVQQNSVQQDSAQQDTAQQEYLVIRRINTEGRSRCYLDDSLVTVGKLNDTLGPFVDLYGQHEHQSLLKPSEQLSLLDTFGGAELANMLKAYQEALRSFREAANELQSLRELSSSSNAEREQASFALREIEKIAPLPGEYEALEADLPKLQNGEQLAEATQEALENIRGERGALERLDVAIKALRDLRGIDTALDETFEQLESLTINLEELASDISHYAQGIEYDPQALQIALDRLGELDGLSRRFGPGMQQVFALIERSELLLKSTEDTDELITAAETALQEATEQLKEAAAHLADLRRDTADEFLRQLNEGIADLALAGASLEFSVDELPFERWGSTGSQSFELLYRPAPSASARPLAKIASGGELSRVMLAIKGLLQTDDKPMTLVFDEIDAGIGGKTANAVAERLASLAKQHQVIVITHLAQIAARAHQHFLVDKVSTDENTQTTIVALTGKKREKEIARMLSGSTDAEALSHAQKLLREAHQ